MANENQNIFEVALRNRFRFPYKGLVSTEDLFSLPLKELDSIYKVLSSELKASQEDSLLNTRTKADKEVELKIEVVKSIVTAKLDEQEKRSKAKKIREEQQQLMALLKDRENEAMQGMTKEQIEQRLQQLRDEEENVD